MRLKQLKFTTLKKPPKKLNYIIMKCNIILKFLYIVLPPSYKLLCSSNLSNQIINHKYKVIKTRILYRSHGENIKDREKHKYLQNYDLLEINIRMRKLLCFMEYTRFWLISGCPTSNTNCLGLMIGVIKHSRLSMMMYVTITLWLLPSI